MKDFKGSRIARLTMAGFLAVTTCGVATGVRAAEEGELVKNVLGKMGFIPEDKDPIHYRERAPLVIPKSGKLALPPPVEGGYGERKLTNWPKDPDVAAARERDTVVPRTQTQEWKNNQGDARLPPEKLKSTRSAGRDPNDRTPVNARNPKMTNSGWVNPDDLRATASQYKDGSTASGEEPSRDILTDPPTGLRKAAGGGTIKPSYEPRDLSDPGSPYYVEQQRRKQAQEN